MDADIEQGYEMNKHYRGKRHTYARKTVSIGRDKKRARKMDRIIKRHRLSIKLALLGFENFGRALEAAADSLYVFGMSVGDMFLPVVMK